MNLEIDKKEAIQSLEDGQEIYVEVGENVFKIADMHNYAGAPEDETGYLSEYIGNVWYDDAEYVINETIEGMADSDKELMKNAKLWID